MLKINFLTKYLIISKLGEYKKFLNIILLKASEKNHEILSENQTEGNGILG